MYKRLIITILIFLTPIAIIEQYRKNNIQEITYLITTNEEFSYERKNCWEENDLVSQQEYYSSDKNIFHNF